MGLGDFHGVFEGARARLGNLVGRGGGPESWDPPSIRRRIYRRRALALAAILALIGIGVGGYSIGASEGVDVSSAEQAGTAAGEQRGVAVGAREGYESAFKSARERAYDAAYRKAYRRAYRQEFEQADLAVPSQVPVSER